MALLKLARMFDPFQLKPEEITEEAFTLPPIVDRWPGVKEADIMAELPYYKEVVTSLSTSTEDSRSLQMSIFLFCPSTAYMCQAA